MVEILHKDLSYGINGILFQVHNSLGRFCKHNQYGDALEVLLKENNIKYKREIEIPIYFKEIKLTGNILDFLIEDAVVLDIKCKKEITTKDYVQMKRYLKATGKELGIIVNFADKSLKIVRILDKK
ncbi:MAG: GxxExxY protein [Candidatus Moranbacteria bacterium CG23_combo_of_CG06-09_8_20_14_all_39_10]|nr:MAG: GxxExxY protein [Candidatus Moranbacteria bacterium CG23_combo_of_CG06-09_8_20_14_all_39_10]